MTALTISAGLLAVGAAFADAALPAGVSHAATVEGISEYRLENGLKVLLFPDDSKPTLTVNITYLVGARHENYGETGMAHLLEHLVFKGTPSHPHIPEEFKQRGARFNGTTSLDRTNYFELLPATDDNLQWAIALEADRMVNSFIAQKDLDSEMTVVRNEFELGENSPQRVLEKRMMSVAYDWHSYGRTPIGNRSDIENVRIENLQAFYRTYYQPDNAVLVLAGKFDPARALQYIADEFGRIASPQRSLPPFWTVEPTQDGERSVVVRRKDDVQIVWVAYKVPSSLHGQSLPLDLAGRILADAPSGRLHRALVESGRAANVYVFASAGYAPGLQIFGAEVNKGEAAETVRDALLREIEAFHRAPPTEAELGRARTGILNQMEQAFNDHESIGVLLSEYIARGDWRLFFKQRDDLAKATAEEIASATRHYYLRDNRTVGMYLPEDHPRRADIPAAPTAAEALRDYRPGQRETRGEVFDPSPANLDARTRRTTVGGLKVALLPKKNRGATVAVSLRLNMGDTQSLSGKQAIASLTAAMIGRGTASMTRSQLADLHDKYQMSGDFWNFETTGPRLTDALRLAAHAIRDASFPADEFAQLKKQTITQLEAQKNDPLERAFEAIGRHFNRYPQGDPRYAASLEERIAEVQAVTLEQVRQFHREFYGASSGQISIVGDFNAAQVKQVLQEEYGAWESVRPYAPVLKAYADIPAARLDIATPDKENAFLFGAIPIELKDDAPDYAAMLVANQILGRGGLSSRLLDRLRQKEGVSYSIYSELKARALDNAGEWTVLAIAAPQNMARAETAIREEIARALQDGFTADEVSDAISNLVQWGLQMRAQDKAVAGTWNEYLFLGRTFTSWSEKLEQQIKAVTPEAANAALRKYIAAEKLSIAIASDPAKR